MKIDLHIHTKTCSDGNLSVEEVFEEAVARGIELISITDHDSVDCQEQACALANRKGISCVTGVEINVTLQLPGATSLSLDFLGYGFDIDDHDLRDTLKTASEYRERRARLILDNLNQEFDKEGIERFTEADLRNIRQSVDGVFGRPHIADYLIRKGIVADKQEAFDKYLVKCDVPKYPLSLRQASDLIRGAGGVLVMAHPSDPNGTSLAGITRDLKEQAKVIEAHILEFIDGIECWHSRHDYVMTQHYIRFAKSHGLLATGGSDCHQKPILMGSLEIPGWVAKQPIFQTCLRVR